MARRRGGGVFGWVLLLLAILPPAAHAQERLLRIGTVSGQFDGLSADSYRPFTDYLSARVTGADFQMVPLPDIEALVREVDQRHLDFALLTPAALIELSSRHEVRPIATVTQMVGEEAYPWLAGAVFVPASRTDMQHLTDLRGKRVLALSPMALGGWLSAVRELRGVGIDERTDLDSVRFLFSYTDVVSEVCSGRADAGVLAAATLRTLEAQCPGGFRVLPGPAGATDPRYPAPVSTRLYPEAAFAVVGNVDERAVTQLAQELLAITPGSEVAVAATVAGFTAPLSYTPVRELMEDLRIGPFHSFGQLTFTEALQQHAGKVTLTLLGFAGVVGLALARSRRLNRELEVSEEFRKRVFEASHLPIVVMDAVTLEYLDCNPAATAIYRFQTREETLGKTPLDVSAPTQSDGRPSAASMRQYVQRALVEGPVEFEWCHRRPDGEIWDAQVHLLSFKSSDRVLMQFTLEDISERKRAAAERAQLEQQLNQSQRMDSIGRLAGAVAHDFNNLLTVINGYSDVLLAELREPDPARRSVVQINKAGRRAAELTQQLLTFSKKQLSRPVPVNVNNALHESETMFRRLLGEDVHLVINAHPALGLTMVDPVQLHQVMMNLIVNARDAMPSGGTVTITTDNADIGEESVGSIAGLQAGPHTVLAVSDTGVGMDSHTVQHIFEPFFSTKGEAGTGLGLSTVYGIVRQNQGAIAVVSERGCGTTFTIYLPRTLQEPSIVAADVRKVPSVAPAERTVLIVEDQDDVRGFATDVLRSAGYRVLEAASGDEALMAGDSHPGKIHLLLTDVVLKGMNGRELSELFKVRHPEAVVLFTSGYADDVIARRGVLQGKIAFLAKPYSPEGLLAKVRTELNHLSPTRLP